MLAKHEPRSSSPTLPRPPSSDPREELARRMARPQRHRLLHGYPMAPLLSPWPAARRPTELVEVDPTRPLLVGVLPHTFCNPRVRGCGFCTFPHEAYSNERARDVAARVAREIRATFAGRREASALYFGGGTANLTPPEAFRAIARPAPDTFDLARAEVSLEGVATYFLTRGEALLDELEAIACRHRRISVGVQSFDAARRDAMGRGAFGDEATFGAVVSAAHRRGMTTSCDLLFAMPGQTTDEALRDVAIADTLGFDQICIYGLVLDPSLDTPWAHDRSLLARRPAPEAACATFLALRDDLLARGFVQTTLTNFERASVHAGERRFRYEAMSFDPATYDALGLGPGAISTFTSRDRRGALKWTNAATSDAYVARMDAHGRAEANAFAYEPIDLRLLHVTRNLSATRIDLARYRAFFGTSLEEDFPGIVEAVVEAGLLLASGALTPRGMYYADAVAGLFAARRAAALAHENDAIAHAMG